MEQWRRPGCIVWAAFVFIAFNVSSVALVLPRPWGWLALPLFLLMMWLPSEGHEETHPASGALMPPLRGDNGSDVSNLPQLRAGEGGQPQPMTMQPSRSYCWVGWRAAASQAVPGSPPARAASRSMPCLTAAAPSRRHMAATSAVVATDSEPCS